MRILLIGHWSNKYFLKTGHLETKSLTKIFLGNVLIIEISIFIYSLIVIMNLSNIYYSCYHLLTTFLNIQISKYDVIIRK